MKAVPKMRKYNRASSKKSSKGKCPVVAGHHRKNKRGYSKGMSY